MSEVMTQQEQEDYIRERLGNQLWRLNNLYYITNKSGQKVLFKMNEAQYFLFTNMHYFNIILKARQLGFSTAIQIFILDSAMFNANLNCGVVAQGLKEAKAIFRTKIQFPYENLPEWLQRAIPIKRKSSDELEFFNGSMISVSTGFRSGTVQILHVSEFAKICATREDKAEEVVDGTLNAVHPGNVAFIESTAEGATGHYYDMCQEAMEIQHAGLPLTDIDFKFFFFPWWDEPTYTMPIPDTGLKLTKIQEEYFSALEKSVGKPIPDDRKQWYITKERQQKGKMKQEFPSTPNEAFLTSGRKVFDYLDLMYADSGTSRPLIIYDINPVTGSRKKVNNRVDMKSLHGVSGDKANKTAQGYLLVWELPEEDVEYVIGGDVAEGLEHGDNSSLDVLCKKTGKQVAHWFGSLSPKRFGDLIAHVGRMYNYAYLGIERNNMGHSTLDRLRDIYPLSYIYSEQYIDREIDDEDTARIGWHTTAASKEMLIGDMAITFEGHNTGIRWAGTMAEMHIFVRNERGSAGAQPGGHDDQVMSYLIAQMMRAKAPAKPKRELEGVISDKPKNWMTR
ncbi:hypothetical protein VPHD85_0001 [Vibrio phage D85]|nr:hypothetical protein PODOV033v1_p0061 [Vibrio phage 252E42.2]